VLREIDFLLKFVIDFLAYFTCGVKLLELHIIINVFYACSN